MATFTKLQKEEILHHITIREETVEDDPESGDAFELTPGALDALRSKVNAGSMDFTSDEIEWMKGELENCEDIAWSNFRSEGVRALGYAASMQNAINKLA